MKPKFLLILIVAGIIFPLYVKCQNFAEFSKTVKECGMTFTPPLKFVESKIVRNADMSYEYALKYKDRAFEVRYAIRPIRFAKYASEKEKKEIEGQRPLRNSSFKALLNTVILNITGGVDYKVQEFDSAAVKKEFNADWGATTFVELNSEFGKGFKYCMIVTIHKKDLADAYYFFMSNSKEKFSENMKPLFHTLKFNR